MDRIEDQSKNNSEDIQELKKGMQELNVKVDHIDDQINRPKVDLSDTVSRKEFLTLKRKVYS